MKPRNVIPGIALGTFLTLSVTQAAIQPYADYPLGEAGSLSGTIQNPQDVSGNGRHFTTDANGASAVIRTDTFHPDAYGSTAYLDTSGPENTGWYGVNYSSLATDNFAFGIFARVPDMDASRRGTVFTLGAGVSAFKVSYESNGWSGSSDNAAWIGFANGTPNSITPDTWSHLAMIRQAGVTTFYIDGVAQGATYSGPPTHNVGHLSVNPGGAYFFDGDIDEARIVTFDASDSTASILDVLQKGFSVTIDSYVYVDESWAGLSQGDPIVDADAGTSGDQPATFGIDAFATLQSGLDQATIGTALTVNSGTYDEEISLSYGVALVVTGADAAQAVSISNLVVTAGVPVEIQGGSVLTLNEGALATEVSGSGSLVKNSENPISFGSANSLTGAVTLNGGTITFTSGGDLGSGLVTVNSPVNLAVSGDTNFGNTITGTAAVTKTGPGALTFSGGASGFSGPLAVTDGRLNIRAGTTLGSSVTVDDGATLGGEGIIAGDLSLGTVSGAGSTILAIDNSTPEALAVTGTLTPNTVVNVSGVTDTSAAIALISYGTAIDNQSGAASLSEVFPTPPGTRATTVDNAGTLEFSFASPETIAFAAGDSDLWQVGGPDKNWSSSDTFFAQGDLVIFDDNVDPLFGGLVTISGNPKPGSITLNNTSALSCNFNGTAIGGSGGLVKNNDGIVTLGLNNTFTGGTTVNGGELMLAAGNSKTPTGTGTLTITAGGTVTCDAATAGHNQLGNHVGIVIPVVINGGTWNPAAYNHFNSMTMTGGNVGVGYTTSGDGLDWRTSGGRDAIITTQASTSSATIAAKATIGSPALFNVADGDAAIDLAYSGNLIGNSGYEKLGDGCMFLSGTNTYAGATVVSAGCLAIEDISAIPGDLTKVSVAAGAGFGGIVGPANLSDANIDAIAAMVQWDAGGGARLILDTHGEAVSVGSSLAGLGLGILAKGGGTLTLSGNVAGVHIITEDDTTVITSSTGAGTISIAGITTSAGTDPGTRKTSIDFTADGDVDVYASSDLSNWGAPIATGVSAASSPYVEDNIATGIAKRFYVLVTAGETFPAP